jgi:hypothetical protein
MSVLLWLVLLPVRMPLACAVAVIVFLWELCSRVGGGGAAGQRGREDWLGWALHPGSHTSLPSPRALHGWQGHPSYTNPRGGYPG